MIDPRYLSFSNNIFVDGTIADSPHSLSCCFLLLNLKWNETKYPPATKNIKTEKVSGIENPKLFIIEIIGKRNGDKTNNVGKIRALNS